MKIQLTVLGERLESAAANFCNRKNPGKESPTADKPPMRRKFRRESPVQSRHDPVTRSSMALYLRAKGGMRHGGKAAGKSANLFVKPDVFCEKVNRNLGSVSV